MSLFLFHKGCWPLAIDHALDKRLLKNCDIYHVLCKVYVDRVNSQRAGCGGEDRLAWGELRKLSPEVAFEEH